MKVIAFLALATLTMNSSDGQLIEVFTRVKSEYKKFSTNTVNYRVDFETFMENEFEPAVDKMIEKLAKKECKKCLDPYLEALTHLTSSASEMISDQLGTVAAKYPKELEKACARIPKDKLKGLGPNFELGIETFTKGKKEQIKIINRSIKKCL